MNAITYRTALELASHEAIVRQAYKDSGGVWTWSIGLTNATGHDVTRYIGKPATMARCLQVYVWALEKYADDVRAVFGKFPLNEAQFAAALSFHYNTGAIRKASWPKLFMAGSMAAAEASLKSWNKDDGHVVSGLVTRRSQEANLLFRGKWSNDGKITEYTKVTSRSTPDWGSGVRVSILAPLQEALNASGGIAPRDPEPQLPPDPEPTAPVDPVTPPSNPEVVNGSLIIPIGLGLAGALALILKYFTG